MNKRRARPTLRCLTDDLGFDLPSLETDLGDVSHPWMDELRRIAPVSPLGQKRILSIEHPLVYRLRLSNERGATRLDDGDVVWLCAVRRREEGSDADAFEWFAELHSAGILMPSDDDYLRDRAEDAIRVHRKLTSELFELVDKALSTKGTEYTVNLDGWLPCRVVVFDSDGIEETWCSLSIKKVNGEFIRPELRDILFAGLELRLSPSTFEARSDWPTGEVPWFESVRLGMR